MMQRTETHPHHSDRIWIAVAALAGALAVVAGAFAAHGLDTAAQAKQIDWLRTGSLYQALHCLAILLVTALSAANRLGRGATLARSLFLAGIVFFPGALYVMALGGPRWLGAVAPIGGSALILGWLVLAAAALTARRP